MRLVLYSRVGHLSFFFYARGASLSLLSPLDFPQLIFNHKSSYHNTLSHRSVSLVQLVLR